MSKLQVPLDSTLSFHLDQKGKPVSPWLPETSWWVKRAGPGFLGSRTMIVLVERNSIQREDEKDPFAQPDTSPVPHTLTAVPIPSELRHRLP